MGVDGASSQLIFFIAATVVAIGAVGVMTTVIYDFNTQIGIKGKALSEALTTDITVVNDPANVQATSSSGTWKVTLYVKNTGTRELDPTQLTVFYDGQYVSYATPTYPGGDTAWRPGVVVQLVVTVGSTQPTGDHAFRVVADGGRFDEFNFNR